MVEVIVPSSQGATEHFIAFPSVTLEILPSLPGENHLNDSGIFAGWWDCEDSLTNNIDKLELIVVIVSIWHKSKFKEGNIQKEE